MHGIQEGSTQRSNAKGDVQRAPSGATSPSRAIQLKSSLRGQQFADQERMLAPSEGPPVQLKASTAAAAVQMDKDKDKAESQELADGGHSLLRHGPEVTDSALERRLKTGMTAKIGDPSAETFSPAPGLATRFKSYPLVNQTRQAATDACAAELQTSIDGVKTPCDAYDLALMNLNDAKTALDKAKLGTDKVAIGKAGGDFGKARGPVSKAEGDVRTKARSYDPATIKGVPLSVGSGAASGSELLTVKPSYKVVIKHGAAIGEGFRGVDKKVGNALGKDGADADVFDDISAKIDVDQTQTAMATGSAGLKGLDPKTDCASWTAGQHYPTDGETPGIS